ncbi:glutaredoxin family protein [Alkalicoccobacillus gibsonii]|uniref:glutaredoxin family protein n=1 Tax=Alkalicoccobacillus gibsonii TaxID=79881 RepID=UPI003516D9AA
MEIIYYSKDHCSLCEKGKKVLDQLGLNYRTLDIYQDDELLETYMFRIPVVTINGQVADEGILSYDKLNGVIQSINQADNSSK